MLTIICPIYCTYVGNIRLMCRTNYGVHYNKYAQKSWFTKRVFFFQTAPHRDSLLLPARDNRQNDARSYRSSVVLKLGTAVPLGSAKQFQGDRKEVADL